jgi:hypothetical protein
VIACFQPSSDDEREDDNDNGELPQILSRLNARSDSNSSLLLDGGSQDPAAERRRHNEEVVLDELRRYEEEGITSNELAVEDGILDYWRVRRFCLIFNPTDHATEASRCIP